MTGPLRILWTSSRHWQQTDDVSVILGLVVKGRPSPGGWVLVHGACPDGGGDWIADRVWKWMRADRSDDWLREPERHDWREYGSFKARNQGMVDAGADICVALATKWASGTGQTARMARRAGIHTVDYGVDTCIEAQPYRGREAS